MKNNPDKPNKDSVNSPALSLEQLAKMRPMTEVLPDLVAAAKRTRGQGKSPAKTRITIRLSGEVIEHFKKSGKGWQSRINEFLLDAIEKP